MQKLVGVIYVSNSELVEARHRSHSTASRPSQQHDTPDSDDEDDATPHTRPLVTAVSDGVVELRKDIIVRPYSDNFVRLGGVGTIRTRIVSPFSQLITELGSVNSMRHPNARPSVLANAAVENTEQPPGEAVHAVSEAENVHEVLMRAFCFSAMISPATSARREIRVVEEMIESPYTFQVPLAYMKCLLLERYMEMDVSDYYNGAEEGLCCYNYLLLLALGNNALVHMLLFIYLYIGYPTVTCVE